MISPPQRGRCHQIGSTDSCGVPQLLSKHLAETLGVFGILQDESALKILGTVQAAGQLEVSAQTGAAGVERAKDGIFL